jgi:GT2 family glycosyltransferase
MKKLNTNRLSPCAVSVIIPLYIINSRFLRDFLEFQKQTFKDFEILVVSDQDIHLPTLKNIRVRFIHTHLDTTGPAAKRDIALRYARGKICAFIDDDAYPQPSWLTNAVTHFKHKDIVAVGGPAITPKEDNYWEQLSGLVYESRLCSGLARYRFVPESARQTDDYPAYNLLVRTDVLKQVGGYGNDFYGGEDTFLCMKLDKLGKIWYDPKVCIYHHRRKLFGPLIAQIANVGKHRGYFAKKFPETSRRWFYFMPSLFVLMIIMLIGASVFGPQIFRIATIGILVGFVGLGALSIIQYTTVIGAFFVGIGILLVHIAYGTFFIKGLCTNNLKQ